MLEIRNTDVFVSYNDIADALLECDTWEEAVANVMKIKKYVLDVPRPSDVAEPYRFGYNKKGEC